MPSRSRLSRFIWALSTGFLAACAAATAPTPTTMSTSTRMATRTLTPKPTTTPTPEAVATLTPHLPGLQPGWATYAPAQEILAQTKVRALAVAPGGELWLGTDEGPYRFDGQSWEKPTQGLSSAYVRALAVGPAGEIWAGTGDGVARFTGQSWQRLAGEPTLSHETFNDIAMSPSGDLWFAMGTSTARFNGEDWYKEFRPLGSQAQYKYIPINAFAITAAGDTWLGTPEGVFYQKDRPETLAIYTAGDGLAHDDVEAIVETADGAMWFGTHGGVSRFDGQAWTTYTEQDGLAGQTVFDIAIGPDGTLWFLTERAVCRYVPETPAIAQAGSSVTFTPIPTYTPTPTPTPLPEPFHYLGSVFDVFFLGDSPYLTNACDGRVWLITDQAVARLDDAARSGMGLGPTLAHLPGPVAGIDAQGRVWAVTEDYSEIAAWNGEAWSVYGPEEGWTPLAEPYYRYVDDASCDPDGRFWLATSQDVRAFDGERWSVFTPADMGMDDNPPDVEYSVFRVTVQQSTGDVWVGACDYLPPGPFGGRGARRFDGTTWHGAGSPADDGCVEAIETYAGNVWLGVDDVLWQYAPDTGAWAEFALPDPEPYPRYGSISGLAADPFGRLWVTTLLCGGASCSDRAIYHVQNGVWNPLLREEPVYTPTLQVVVTDASGTSWLFSDAVYRLEGARAVPELDLLAGSVAEDPAGRVWFLIAEYPQTHLVVIDGTARP